MRLPMFYDSNIAPSTTTRSYDVRDLAGSTQSTFSVPFYTTRLNTTTGPILTGVSDVNSWYNSFVLTFRKRMSRHLQRQGHADRSLQPQVGVRVIGPGSAASLRRQCGVDPASTRRRFPIRRY